MVDPISLATAGGEIGLLGGLIGSAIGIAIAGCAGAATLAEDPAQFRNVIVLASLPMTQTFYGLIILILIIVRTIPALQAMPEVGGNGFVVFAIGILVLFVELLSAIYQGKVCASGISMLPKTGGRILTSAMMLAVFVELIGVFGLVFTILSLTMLGLF
jgi:V/A-type H+-transporting ATPase subunit K